MHAKHGEISKARNFLTRPLKRRWVPEML